MTDSKETTWEQRWHPLREEWVMLAAHRQDRPWIGETVDSAPPPLPPYESTCTLCPGNTRVSGIRNESYDGVFAFDNDHPCVGPQAPTDLAPAPGLYTNQPAQGLARVVCFSPRHDLTLAEMSLAEIEAVLVFLRSQQQELGARPEVKSVHIFENKGEVVGVSNPHPHGQIYAPGFVFKTTEIEHEACRKHHEQTGRVLFQDILQTEEERGEGMLHTHEHAAAFVPYFARYAYEVYVAPRQTHPSLAGMSDTELSGLAEVLQKVLIQYDNLWQMSFPYIMAFHQAPTDGRDNQAFHFHIELHPPLRKPKVLKYLAGAEVGAGNFLSDTVPEQRAAELRALPTTHYKLAQS